MADSSPDTTVVRFPGRLNTGDSGAQWKDTVAETQRHLDRSIGALEAYVAQASSKDTNAKGSGHWIRAVTGRGPWRRWAIGVAGLCVPLCLAVTVSWLAAATTVAGLAVIALIAVGVIHIKGMDAMQTAAMDATFAYKPYLDMQAIVARQWMTSDVKDPRALEGLVNDVISAMLSMEARRVTHANKRPTTLVLLEDAGGEFVVRRTSASSLGSRLTRGMRCPDDTLLDATLDHYAQFHYKVQYSAYDRSAYLVALSDVPFSSMARAMVEQAALQYQSMALFTNIAMEASGASA